LYVSLNIVIVDTSGSKQAGISQFIDTAMCANLLIW